MPSIQHGTDRRRGGELGALLRSWRSTRGKSQLDLALDANLSQRHLSFIESGRSAPGRETLVAIAEALDIPLRDRNALLLAAGYAPLYREAAWDAPQLQSVTAAVDRMLRLQEPYPAVLMDRYWNVLAANDATLRFFGLFIDMAARPAPRNILHLMFDPAGMRPFICDWDRVSASLLTRVRREAVGGVIDARLQSLIAALEAYPPVEGPAARSMTVEDEALPMIPLGFEKDGMRLRYFSMVSTLGTPAEINAQELRVECMFPADEITQARHVALMSSPSGA
ncbi:helix-turn-helix domain-containing protein [Novosphingobium terrae]|uniref:helix-turn-helix domain-containing protein n=1 Tax=Novosphingobium terrae TaxID=2726189 RepID=UPI001F130274|nr:helix-turn-helix transcriptional regulator [Novosphingobium terrae]